MSTKECCRTCQHCVAGEPSAGSWCRIRKITLHQEIALLAFCHHWLKSAPSLPSFQVHAKEDITERQLELDRSFVSIEN